MQFISTKKTEKVVTFRDALFRGQAPDGGLYMPIKYPTFNKKELLDIANLTYPDFAFEIASKIFTPEIAEPDLVDILTDAYNFAPDLHFIDKSTTVLELFHGPTLSFKDFGAQFMAKSMEYFLAKEGGHLTILVATSGDTGSAVAHAYHNVECIDIVLLYPSGKVSFLQEKQFTTLGGNITALEVNGTFDECQALVKQAFKDEEIQNRINPSSANSINIGRLLPQSFYYFWGISQLLKQNSQENIVVCVPSGNFGNITAALFANQMGVSVEKFIAAVNSNSVIPEYFQTREYKPRPSIQTLSNAMDVGNPSNWERIRTIFSDDYDLIKEKIWSISIDDETTKQNILNTFVNYHYVPDPHTAVGLEAVKRYRNEFDSKNKYRYLTLSTAHPGKFIETVDNALGYHIQLPPALSKLTHTEKHSIQMNSGFDNFKDFLLSKKD